MMIRYLTIMIIFLLIIAPASYAQPFSLEVQNVNLTDAIRLVAKFTHRNIIISPSVQGVVTLSLQNANPDEAFALLLASHGLAEWRANDIGFVAPQTELIKRRQDELQWQQVNDAAAPLVTAMFQIHYAKAEEVAHLLQDEHASLLSKRGQVRVDARTNTLCLQDIATQMTTISRVIQRLDVPVQQILIAARLASVDSDFERALGLRFTLQPNVAPTSGDSSETNTRSDGYSVALAKLPDGSALDIKLSALENAGHAELISSPRLYTANQQTAEIAAGEEVPYQETSRNGATSVVFKKAVLSLKVTPQVLPGGKVLLQLQVNQDKPSNQSVLGVPTIATRQITTQVLMRNNQTVVLGGIYESSREQGEERVPFVSRVPLLGLLFKQSSTREKRRELLIFVTPRIISGSL